MIRFLDLKNQTYEGQNSFAFFDTITDTILIFEGEQVFDDVNEFKLAYNNSYMNKEDTTRPLDRFIRLIPEDFFEKQAELNN